jgi:hypothetical protein
MEAIASILQPRFLDPDHPREAILSIVRWTYEYSIIMRGKQKSWGESSAVRSEFQA